MRLRAYTVDKHGACRLEERRFGGFDVDKRRFSEFPPAAAEGLACEDASAKVFVEALVRRSGVPLAL